MEAKEKVIQTLSQSLNWFFNLHLLDEKTPKEKVKRRSQSLNWFFNLHLSKKSVPLVFIGKNCLNPLIGFLIFILFSKLNKEYPIDKSQSLNWFFNLHQIFYSAKEVAEILKVSIP